MPQPLLASIAAYFRCRHIYAESYMPPPIFRAATCRFELFIRPQHTTCCRPDTPLPPCRHAGITHILVAITAITIAAITILPLVDASAWQAAHSALPLITTIAATLITRLLRHATHYVTPLLLRQPHDCAMRYRCRCCYARLSFYLTHMITTPTAFSMPRRLRCRQLITTLAIADASAMTLHATRRSAAMIAAAAAFMMLSCHVFFAYGRCHYFATLLSLLA